MLIARFEERFFLATSQGNKKMFSASSLYNQILLPAGSNPKGIQRNEIWEMDAFHFAEFGKLNYVHHRYIFVISIGNSYEF